jgi:hypothetical protein
VCVVWVHTYSISYIQGELKGGAEEAETLGV